MCTSYERNHMFFINLCSESIYTSPLRNPSYILLLYSQKDSAIASDLIFKWPNWFKLLNHTETSQSRDQIPELKTLATAERYTESNFFPLNNRIQTNSTRFS